jgi:phage baseplate assembly protein V
MSDSVLRSTLRRVLMLASPGRVRTGADTGLAMKLQVQLGANEIRDALPRLPEYGFASFPLPGSNALVIFPTGDRSNGVVVATDDPRYRVKLQPGEAALYDDLGKKVHLTRTKIVIDAAGQDVEIDNAGTVTINATTAVIMNTPLLKVSGDIIDNYATNTRTMGGMRTVYNTHTHNDPQGGVTGAPNQPE